MTRKSGGVSAARSALLDAAPAGSGGAPASFLARFQKDSQGVFLAARDDKPRMWLSAPLDVLAEVRDPDGRGWGLLLSWHDRDGRRHEEVFARQMFAGECGELRGRLADGGLSMNGSRTAREAFADYLNALSSPVRAQSVTRIGWHQLGTDGGSIFVLRPDKVFGATPERVVLQLPDREPSQFNESGTLAEWQGHVAGQCVGNSRLVFALCCAFAAPVLGMVLDEGGGFNLLGGSRIGKSTALRVAASVWGGAGRAGAGAYIVQWRATSNGLEAVAVRYCNVLLVIDEMSQVDAHQAGEIAYMLANGQGKSRGARAGSGRAVVRFPAAMFLSSGEVGLADKNAEAGRTTRAGQEVRLADVPADAGAGFGLFEELHGARDASAFVDDLHGTTARLYGTAGTAFLEALTALIARDAETAALIRERAQALRTAWLAALEDVGGQVLSVAFRFALVAIAGEMATELKLTGWPAGTAARGVERCFRAWLAQRGTLGAREDEQAVIQLRDFIHTHGSARFEVWQEPDEATQAPSLPAERFRTVSRAGWRRATLDEADGRLRWTYYLTPAAMKEATTGLSMRDALKVLAARGYITPDHEGRNSHSVEPPGLTRTRLYIVAPSLLTGVDDD